MREVAKRIRVPETTYREWEYGRAMQGQPYVAIARALGVSLHELMTGETARPDKLFELLSEAEASLSALRAEIEKLTA